MSKRIILLSDGTGNSAAKVWRTNIWRTFESIDLTKPDQIAIYDDGVGTSSFKPAAILGGAFGFGLKRNVLTLYKFLCRNYKSSTDYQHDGVMSGDDEIFAFGFSRGAFTIRVLVGFVLDQGLVKFETEEQLNQKAKAAYRAYRRHFTTITGVEAPFRAIRNWFVTGTHDSAERPVKHIRFLGLWDTVAAYGLPLDEMTYGISRYIWPLELPNRVLNSERVQRASHALSLDDERTTFHPVLWDESELWANKYLPVQANDDGDRLTTDEKVSQVWFAGVHANVGGGYPDDSLAHVSLNWMLDQAKACDLRFKATEVDARKSGDPTDESGAPGSLGALSLLKGRQDPDGRLYDSRSGLGGYYRYGPRNVTDLSNSDLHADKRDRVSIPLVKIHESAMSRMKVNAHIYAPISLPEKYEIVTNQSKIVPPDSIKPTANARPRYESSTEAKERHKHQENIVWSYVWRRRVVYFLTVIASLHLALYPLVLALPDSAELTTRLRPLSDLIRLVALVLPSGLDRWIRAYAGDPTWFLVSAGAVGGLMWASTQVRGRITDEMTANWRASFTNAHRTPSPRTGALSPFSFSWLHKFIFAVLLFIVVYRPLVWIAPSIPTYLWTPLSAFLDRMAAGIIWFLVVATTLALLLPTKVIARFRTRPEYKRTVLNIKRKYAPLLFAVLLPLIGLAFASHYLFNIRDSFGSFCEESRVNGETIRSTNRGLKICTEANRANCARIKIDETARPACGSNCTGKVLEFDTRSLCTATGIFLEKGARYHLLLEQKGPWTFAWTPSDTRGMPIEAFDPPDNSPLRAQIKSYAIKLLMLTMYPLKRTFDRPWGHVITRYGSTGTEENFIDPGEERRADRREELFTPTRDGEMFIYLNQPVLGLWADALGFFNSGTAVVTVTRVPRR